MPTRPDAASPATESRPSTFSSLRNAHYRRLWFVGVLGFGAVQMQVIARSVLAEDLTGTNTGLGGVLLGFAVPMLITTPFGGVAADRFSKRSVLMLAQALLTVSALAVAIAVQTDTIEYWMLVAAHSGAQGVAFAFLGPARVAMTSDIVDSDELPGAISMTQASVEATRVVGPLLASAMIAAPALGAAGVYFLGAALSGGALVLAARLTPGNPPVGKVHRHPLAELSDGVRYVRGRPLIGLLVLGSIGLVMFGFPYLAFQAIVVEQIFELDASLLGVLYSANALGAISGSLGFAPLARRSDVWVGLALAGLGFAGGIAIMAIAPNFAVACIGIAVAGAGASAFQATNMSLVLQLADLEYHGRVQSLIMLSFSAQGFAALPYGIVADLIGLRETFGIMALLVALTMGAFSLRRRAIPEPPTPMLG